MGLCVSEWSARLDLQGQAMKGQAMNAEQVVKIMNERNRATVARINSHACTPCQHDTLCVDCPFYGIIQTINTQMDALQTIYNTL